MCQKDQQCYLEEPWNAFFPFVYHEPSLLTAANLPSSRVNLFILYKKRHEFKSFTVRFHHFYTFICNILPGLMLLWVERLKKKQQPCFGARLTQENSWFSLTTACHVFHPRFCDLKGLKWQFVSLHIIKTLCFAAYLRETSKCRISVYYSQLYNKTKPPLCHSIIPTTVGPCVR